MQAVNQGPSAFNMWFLMSLCASASSQGKGDEDERGWKKMSVIVGLEVTHITSYGSLART